MAYYIADKKTLPFSISKQMEETIHQDFALEQQQARQSKKSIDDGTLLMQRLVLAECISKSYGSSTLTEEAWVKAGKMEKERLARLA